MTDKQKQNGFLAQAQLFLFCLLFVLFSWTQWWAGVMPRLIRGSEERLQIHHAHLNLGATLFVISVLFLVVWVFKPGQSPIQKIKYAFRDCSSTAVSLFIVTSLMIGLYGFGQAWSKGEEVAAFGVFKLPHFINWSWQTSGYMHASTSTIGVYLFFGIVFVYLYRRLIEHMQPGVAVAVLIMVHLLIALPKPPSLHPIAAFGEYVLTPLIYLTALALYVWANNRKFIYWPVFGVFILFFLYLPYFAFKVSPPWHQSAAKPVTAVESQTRLSPIRSRDDIFVDAAELTAAEETTSWCRQCHTVNRGGEALLGPNLAGVFNKQIATSDDFGRYSSALSSKGEAGVFWTKENLAEFLTDGQNFAPGNLMNQQTDFSDPEKLKQALDYLEYISAE